MLYQAYLPCARGEGHSTTAQGKITAENQHVCDVRSAHVIGGTQMNVLLLEDANESFILLCAPERDSTELEKSCELGTGA